MTRTLICCVPWNDDRFRWGCQLAAQTGGELILDRHHDGYDTFQRALEAQQSHDAWHLQDDAILTSRWDAKTRWETQSRPNVVIQGFSRRKADLEVGSRWHTGGDFLCCVCWFLPGRLAPALLAYSRGWQERETERMSTDVMIASFLRLRRERYWLRVPSLAQHRVGPSMVGPRAQRRESQSFVP